MGRPGKIRGAKGDKEEKAEKEAVYPNSYPCSYNSNPYSCCGTRSRNLAGDLGIGLNPFSKTSDGGYIITGYTKSFGAGECNVCLLKTDRNRITFR